MRDNFDDSVKEWFPLKNGNLIVKLGEDENNDDYDKTNSIKTMLLHFGRYFSSHSKRLMNDVIKQLFGFFKKNYNTDTDPLFIQKKY